MNDPKIGERYKHKYATDVIIVINRETSLLSADYGKVVYYTISETHKCEERLDTFRDAWELIVNSASEIKMLIKKLEL